MPVVSDDVYLVKYLEITVLHGLYNYVKVGIDIDCAGLETLPEIYHCDERLPSTEFMAVLS